MLHNAGGPMLNGASGHREFAIANFLFFTFGLRYWKPILIKPFHGPKNGCLSLSENKGLGIKFREEKLASEYQACEYPSLSSLLLR